MLSGPAADYFTDSHLRGGFPTPNESSLRSGLTPGGSGSMFPAPSPNSQGLFAQLISGGATPNTIDFHRTAMSAASKRDGNLQQSQLHQQHNLQPAQPPPQPQPLPQVQVQQPVTSQPQDMTNGTVVKAEGKQPSGPFDGHDNDAANGLYMLAQGRNGPQGPNPTASHPHPAPAAAPKVNGNAAKHTRGASEATNASEEQHEDVQTTRGKGKKNQAGNNRRKADEPPSKPPPSKKTKASAPPPSEPSEVSDDDDDIDPITKSKMTDEEKRKNFLERNR